MQNTPDPAAHELASRLFVRGRWLGWQYVPAQAPPDPTSPPDSVVRRATQPPKQPVRVRLPQVNWHVPRRPEAILAGVLFLATVGAKNRGFDDSATGTLLIVALLVLFWRTVPSLLFLALAATLTFGARSLIRIWIGIWRALMRGVEAVVPEVRDGPQADWRRDRGDQVIRFVDQGTGSFSEFMARLADRLRRKPRPRWFPVQSVNQQPLVQVFGGTPEGWSALLCTTVPGLIEAGRPVMVIDLSRQDVTWELEQVCLARPVPVSTWTVGVDVSTDDLLAGLRLDQVADVVAAAVTAGEDGPERSTHRSMIWSAAEELVSALPPPLTIARILGSVIAVQRHAQRKDGLTLGEEDQIRTRVRLEKQRDQEVLGHVRSRLHHLLPRTGAGALVPGEMVETLFAGPGLRVLRVDEPDTDRRAVLGALVLRVFAERLQDVQAPRTALVVVGADEIGYRSVHDLTQHSGDDTDVILFSQRFEGSMDRMLGIRAVTAFMRLPGGKEAATAAEHIGSEHRFVVSQYQVQYGTSSSISRARSTNSSYQSGSGTSRTRQPERLWWDTLGHNSNHSRSVSVGDSRQSTFGTTENYSSTWTRQKEEIVEPTVIQNLAETELLLVDSNNGRRELVTINCNPALALDPATASAPLLASPDEERA